MIKAKELTLLKRVCSSLFKSISIKQTTGFPIVKVLFWITFDFLFDARLFETTL